METIVSIQKHDASSNRVFLCPALADNYRKGEIITIQYGQETVRALVTPIKKAGVIAFSYDIWDRLSLPFPHKVHAASKENLLLIGPLVGIMTTGIRNHPTKPLGQRTGFFLRYVLTQRDVPVSCCVFSPAEISRTKRRVNGYFLRKRNGKWVWEAHQIPYPNVVFNRVFRRGEKLKFVIEGRDLLERTGVKVFNPFTFNKWRIHELISNDMEVQSYIPESVLNPSLHRLAELLKKYRLIYLKPVEGYLGLGIFQLTLEKNRIACRYNQGGRNHLRRFSNLRSLIQHCFKGKGLGGYIAQQGIQLLQMDRRNIDFRVHVNRDRHGKWQMTGIAAKIAGKGSVTTHVRTGGNILAYEQVLDHFFSAEQQQIVKRNINLAVIRLARAIESHLPQYVGEIGFDIGVDQSGHPWMFEANSQPGRHVFVHPSMEESEFLTRKGIFDYALYLSGFLE
jgi:hypothetical protein